MRMPFYFLQLVQQIEYELGRGCVEILQLKLKAVMGLGAVAYSFIQASTGR